jgi:magnesium-protoporphyrin IX monomethyl ester (oxidative) cyclase
MQKQSFIKRKLSRVCLVSPPVNAVAHFEPYVATPMGLAYLGASLRERGFEVLALDAVAEAPYQADPINATLVRYGLTVDKIVRRVLATRPDVVGLSCLYTNQWPVVREIAQALRAREPEILLVTGGTHPTYDPESCLRDSKLNMIVLGEGDHTFPKALQCLNDGRGLDDLPGVAWRNGDAIRNNGTSPLIDDLDTLPFPAHDLFPIERYFKLALPPGYSMRSRRSLPIITSRGCPCRCTFCASTVFWQHRYRARSADNVLAEIDWLRTQFGIEEVKFLDDNLTANRERAMHIFGALAKRSPRLHWNAPNGLAIWTVDDEMLKLMKSSGCFEIAIPVESGDQGVLNNLLHKPLLLEKALEINRAARRLGIFRLGYFIIGFPGETRAQIDATVRFSRRLDLDWNAMFIYTPLPGSPLFEECKNRGMLPAEYYETGNVYFSPSLSSPEWNGAELEKIIRREHLRNYLSIFKNPTVVIPSFLALIRNRPGIFRFTLLRIVRTFKLALGIKDN